MQTGYTLINVFIWAIPILGFIGTVFGIGQSIGEFSQFIRGVETSELSTQMRSALSGVTQGLSVAFNTTFLALVGVIPVMLLSSTLRKGEEDLLLSVEEYCLEDLLPNLHVRPGEETMDEAVHEHLGKLVEFSENWRKQVAPVMSELEKQSESLKHQVIEDPPDSAEDDTILKFLNFLRFKKLRDFDDSFFHIPNVDAFAQRFVNFMVTKRGVGPLLLAVSDEFEKNQK